MKAAIPHTLPRSSKHASTQTARPVSAALQPGLGSQENDTFENVWPVAHGMRNAPSGRTPAVASCEQPGNNEINQHQQMYAHLAHSTYGSECVLLNMYLVQLTLYCAQRVPLRCRVQHNIRMLWLHPGVQETHNSQSVPFLLLQ
jgi:hypothetical protein